MAKRRIASQRSCFCTTSGLPFSSALLFLSIILPSTSYAQITEQPSSTAPTSSIPSTLSSSILPSSTTATSTPTIPSSPPQNPNNDNDDDFTDNTPPITDQGAHVFRFYFLIIALVAILFILLILYLGHRRKRKAAILRTNSQRALAQDVAGFHQRFGRGNNIGGMGTFFSGGYAARTREVRVEGLNERGEAPPPYIPGTKPPSLRSRGSSSDLGTARVHSSGSGHGEGWELRDMNGTGTEVGYGEPPGYHEHVNAREEEDLGDMTRPSAPPTVSKPDNAVVVEERTTSAPTRRLLGSSSDVV